MDGIWIIVALLSIASFWYGARPFLVALRLARYGILHVPALVVGAVELWVGGLLGLAAGTLVREPPALPDRSMIVGWTVVMFVLVLGVVVLRRTDVEERLPQSARRGLDGRFIALGAVAAAAVLLAFGYL